MNGLIPMPNPDIVPGAGLTDLAFVTQWLFFVCLKDKPASNTGTA